MRPVEQISFDVFRGTSGDRGWPLSADVGKESFLGLIRMKTNIPFDLPTEVQWEYACRAGTNTKYNNGGNDLLDMFNVGKCFENGGTNDHHCVVGSFQPNHWGLYDMQGNVWEWCLDRSNNSWCIEDWTRDLKESEIDPKGPVLGKERILRGGSFLHAADNCLPWIRHTCESTQNFYHFGFRLAIQSPCIQTTTCLKADLSKTKREMEEKIAAQREDQLYCVVDLSGGPNAKRYPVSYLNSAPKTGWPDEYKTTKLVLRKIKPGKEPLGRYVITNGYYIGVFEVTQRQWELVCGKNPSEFVNPMHPVEMVSYGVIRGTSLGDAWVRTIDKGTFVGNMRDRAGLKFDLPVEKQWEYACRAGTVSFFNNGGNDIDDLLKLGKFEGNGGRTEYHSQVGSFAPNAWGIYDMHGNVRECCLDWASSSQHISRGGNFLNNFNECTSTFRGHSMSHDGVRNYVGFRLVILP